MPPHVDFVCEDGRDAGAGHMKRTMRRMAMGKDRVGKVVLKR